MEFVLAWLWRAQVATMHQVAEAHADMHSERTVQRLLTTGSDLRLCTATRIDFARARRRHTIVWRLTRGGWSLFAGEAEGAPAYPFDRVLAAPDWCGRVQLTDVLETRRREGWVGYPAGAPGSPSAVGLYAALRRNRPAFTRSDGGKAHELAVPFRWLHHGETGQLRPLLLAADVHRRAYLDRVCGHVGTATFEAIELVAADPATTIAALERLARWRRQFGVPVAVIVLPSWLERATARVPARQ